MGFSIEDFTRIVLVSEEYGSPYVLMCRVCGENRVCVLIRVSPTDLDEYGVFLEGLLVVVGSDRVLDKEIETIMKTSSTIKHVGGETTFYIPRGLSRNLYKYLCRDVSWRDVEPAIMPIEDYYIYVEEGGDDRV